MFDSFVSSLALCPRILPLVVHEILQCQTPQSRSQLFCEIIHELPFIRSAVSDSHDIESDFIYFLRTLIACVTLELHDYRKKIVSADLPAFYLFTQLFVPGPTLPLACIHALRGIASSHPWAATSSPFTLLGVETPSKLDIAFELDCTRGAIIQLFELWDDSEISWHVFLNDPSIIQPFLVGRNSPAHCIEDSSNTISFLERDIAFCTPTLSDSQSHVKFLVSTLDASPSDNEVLQLKSNLPTTEPITYRMSFEGFNYGSNRYLGVDICGNTIAQTLRETACLDEFDERVRNANVDFSSICSFAPGISAAVYTTSDKYVGIELVSSSFSNCGFSVSVWVTMPIDCYKKMLLSDNSTKDHYYQFNGSSRVRITEQHIRKERF